jgi:uronate dehydrogenase
MNRTDLSRRRFLAGSGLGAAGLAGGVSAECTQGAPDREASGRKSVAQSVLITSGETPLAQAIAERLSRRYRVRLAAQQDLQTEFPVVKCVLEADESTTALVRGNDAVVHVARPAVPDKGTAAIDHRTRLTYNLLQAAAKTGVRRVVYLSSLELLIDYDRQFDVTEDWRPRPGSDPRLLSHYLGEFTCREFAREGRLSVVVLRLGTVVPAEEMAGRPFQPLWVDQRNAVEAVSLALAALESDAGRKLGPWSVFHVQSDSPRARFSVNKAKKLLGYKPQFNR